MARRLASLGFDLVATSGTAAFLASQGLEAKPILKVHEGRPNIADALANGEIDLVVNTPLGRESHEDDAYIRTTALKHDVPCITTLSGAMAAVEGIANLISDELSVRSLQSLHEEA